MSTSAQYIPGLAELGRKNQANGYVGIDGDGVAFGTIVNRSMTYAELIDGVIPEVGECVYCTDTRDVHVGDGSTVGGLFHSSPRKPITASNVGVTISTEGAPGQLVIGTFSLKANCHYVLRGRFILTDGSPTLHNIKIKIQQGDTPAVYPTVSNSGTPPIWTQGGVLHGPTIFSDTGYDTYQLSGVSKLAPTQVLFVTTPRYNTTDETLDIIILKIAADAGVIAANQVDVHIQRVA